jgi:cysteine desulfurase / selenocysteine lyase
MDVERIRRDFPILAKPAEEKPLIYLDSACQTLRPSAVIEAVSRYYEEFPACAGRSVHKLATRVSIEVDAARERIARFLNVGRAEEVCFQRNCTEALNTVIFGLGLRKGDVVLASDREHNSVHVPLLMLSKEAGVDYQCVPSRKDESFDLELFGEMVQRKKPKLVAMCHTSNVNGSIIPAREIARIAHEREALVLLDGAQYAPYGGVDMEKLEADFYAFSCHKMCGPSGVGVLAGRFDLLSKLRPLTYGGHGVSSVTKDGAELMPPPERFEPGLQNYAGMIGAGIAADYIASIGREDIERHVAGLNALATGILSERREIKIISPADPARRSGILSFNIDGRNPHDIAMMLDHTDNIMIRSGSHCAHSWFDYRNIQGSARASFYIYNTKEEAERFSRAAVRLVK